MRIKTESLTVGRYAIGQNPPLEKTVLVLLNPTLSGMLLNTSTKKFTGDLANEIYVNQGIEPVFRLLSQGVVCNMRLITNLK